MGTKILSGRELAGYIKERQAHMVRSLLARHIKPSLTIIRDSDDPVITKYVGLKKRYGEDIGVEVRESTGDDLAALIHSANDDPTTIGLILQLPICDRSATDKLCDLIAPGKDVDGLGKNAKFDSATATAILWLLTGYNIDLANAKIAIVGRGKLVGAPLLRIFQNSGYDVAMFHRGSDLTKLRDFGIIISATGVPGLIQNDFISPGTVLVDAGTASEKGEIKGDLDPALYDRTDLAAITPRLGGVGPLTVACLFEHVLEAC